MEEFIGFGLVGVVALLLVLGVKKLFTKSWTIRKQFIKNSEREHRNKKRIKRN